jgi:beta-glucosidase
MERLSSTADKVLPKSGSERASSGRIRRSAWWAMALSMSVGLTLAPQLTRSSGASVNDAFAPKVDSPFRDDGVDAGARIDDIMSKLTLEEKIAMATGGSSAAVARLGLNAGRGGGGEGLHGVVGGLATVFPSALGMSQSWDTDLFHSEGDIIAKESIADNGNIGRLAPVMDLLHDPRAGRDYETMGEDADLTGTLGTAMTAGMNARTADGYQQFQPILKHFLGYNNEINRLWTNTVMPARDANEYYERVFKYPIAAGNAKSVMTSYPLINGKPVPVNPILGQMLTQWTPDYEGTGHDEFRTINDYGSGSSLWVHSQRYFPDDPDGRALGSAEAVKNGQMSWSFRSYGNPTTQVYDALARGQLTEKDIDEDARRNLAMSLRMGDFDQLAIKNPYTSETTTTRSSLLPGNRKTALQASQEQLVLLKDDAGALPLQGSATHSAVLLGSLGEEVLKDYYTGNYAYDITIKNALDNKLGASNVYYNRAVDTVALKASNGKYLTAANNATNRDPGASNAADTPIQATGTAATDNSVQLGEKNLIFERYDFGGLDQLLRTPINDQYVQVPHTLTATANKGTLVNDTGAPGEGDFPSGSMQYVNYQKLRIVPTNDGKFGLYSPVAGNGGNNSYGASAEAYDQDDEDLNNGSYLRLMTGTTQTNQIVADTAQGHVGPYRDENHTAGPSITQAPFDHDGADQVVDSLPDNYKFDMQTVQSSTQAIDKTLAAAPADAPVIVVVGYEPHLNAREAVDLESTGLSQQQMANIDYVTQTKGRDVVLIVKTGSPMTIDARVKDNPKVKAIIEMGHSGQEEGSALVSALFDDGYSVPATGWEPASSKYGPTTYTSYPGYLDAGNTVPAYSPSGRLSATWYKQISDMVGASDDHPPASYRWPSYDESTDDNLTNLNGTVPTGLLTYDIIKGQRTYQYFKGTPLYDFGYGLTYTTFKYSDVAVSPIAGGKFTVSGKVTNTGARTSDEVVEIYSKFTGTPSRIVQPENRLIAFQRVKAIAANETRPFSFDVDLTDKLGVWDVEAGKFIVEPGTYRIKAAESSSDTGTAADLSVTTANGGTPAAGRNLNREVLAENFDDYSNLGGKVQDMELVSASDQYDSNTAVSLRQNGAWLAYKGVSIPAGTSSLTLHAGSDRAGAVKVYALPVGSDPAAALGSATPIATLSLQDTRPVGGIPTGLGTGPFSVIGQPFGNLPYPGSRPGQSTLDAHGQPYKNAYVNPDLRALSTSVSVSAGSYDVYIVTQSRGARLDWFNFGSAPSTTAGLAISQPESLNSIRAKGGTLPLQADPSPVTSVSPVTWSVANVDGTPTGVATISSSGVLQATGMLNGTVRVTASSSGRTATKDVLVTNQLDANKVTVNGNPMTVDYVLLRTGASFGATDDIQRFQGTSQQSAVFSGLYSENANGYYLSGTYLTLPATALDWTVKNADGSATTLATVNSSGLVTATGAGDGEVAVTATLRNNPDITGTRVLALTNQSSRTAFKMIQAENYDTSSTTGNAASTFGNGGNEFGMEIAMPANSTWTFKNVAFGDLHPNQIAVRLAPNANAATAVSIDVWADAATAAAGGTLLGTVTGTTAASSLHYDTFVTNVTTPLVGVHDVILKPTTALRVNWFTFTGLNTVSADGPVGGTVPATLSLSLGSAASFGTFVPGVAQDYVASTTANVVSTAGDAALSVTDPNGTVSGHLVNGSFSLTQALQARATNTANPSTSYAAVSGDPLTLLTYPGPVSNDPVALGFKQTIGATDALRTGSYSKTLTFTLSTTSP